MKFLVFFLDVSLVCLAFAPLSFAKVEICGKLLGQGSVEKMSVYALFPGQFAVGAKVAQVKIDKLKNFNKEDRMAYLENRPVSVILGPENRAYLVDGHHLSFALIQAGHDQIWVRVIEDWSHLSHDDFAQNMADQSKVRLVDEHGQPRDFYDLPVRIDLLPDDPYRTLADFVQRKKGFFKDRNVLFQEFIWGDYLRGQPELSFLAPGASTEDYEKALTIALRLAHSTGAAGLPGYIPANSR